MDKTSKNKSRLEVFFVQPAYAKYRQPLFERFQRFYNTTFYFMEGPHDYLEHRNSKLFSKYKELSRSNSFLRYLIDIPIKCLYLFLQLMQNNFSVVVTSISNSPQTLVSFLVSKIKRKKCVLWIEEWFLPKRRSLKALVTVSLPTIVTRYILNKVDAIVVEGKAQYNYVKTFKIPDEKIFFSNHCSLDFSKFRSANLKAKLDISNGLVILYLGRIILNKGLHILIKAFSKLESERNDVFLIVCGDGDMRPYCEDLVKQLELKHVLFQGVVRGEEAVASYYKTSDVVVVCSLIGMPDKICAEGWGLALNEAMSMEKPVISTNAVGATPDLVKNGVNGYVVRHGNPEELYFALKKILENEKLRKSMAKNSRKMFEVFNDFDEMFNGFKRAIDYVTK